MLGSAEMQQYEDARVRAELEKIQREREELTRRLVEAKNEATHRHLPESR